MSDKCTQCYDIQEDDAFLKCMEDNCSASEDEKKCKEQCGDDLVCYSKCTLEASDSFSTEDIEAICAPDCENDVRDPNQTKAECMQPCVDEYSAQSIQAETCQIKDENGVMVVQDQETCKNNLMNAQASATKLNIFEGGNALINHCAPCMITEMGTFDGKKCNENNAFLSDEHKNKGESWGATFEEVIAKSSIKDTVPTCKSMICTLFEMSGECNDWRKSKEGKDWCAKYGESLANDMTPC